MDDIRKSALGSDYVSRPSARNSSAVLDKQIDPKKMLMRRLSDLRISEISRQREFEKRAFKLKEEFNNIDKNQNGLITLDELVAFLDEQVYKMHKSTEWSKAI